MKYIIVLGLLLLTGCGSIQRIVCEDNSPSQKEVFIDPRYLEDCKPLQVIPKEEITFEKVLANTAENAIIYAECRSNHSGNIRLIKKLGNIP